MTCSFVIHYFIQARQAEINTLTGHIWAPGHSLPRPERSKHSGRQRAWKGRNWERAEHLLLVMCHLRSADGAAAPVDEVWGVGRPKGKRQRMLTQLLKTDRSINVLTKKKKKKRFCLIFAAAATSPLVELSTVAGVTGAQIGVDNLLRPR